MEVFFGKLEIEGLADSRVEPIKHFYDILKNPETIRFAKEKYLKVFNGCYDVRDKLSEKLERIVQSIFSRTFNLRSRSDVKKLFAKFILKRQVDVRKLTIKIGKITKKLMNYYNRTMVEKQDFLSAIVLYYLSERKHDYNQLEEKLSEVDSKINLEAIVSALKFAGLIEQEDDYYKINVEALI